MSETIFPDMGNLHPGYMGYHAIDAAGQVAQLKSDSDKVRIHRVLYRNRLEDLNPYHITLWAGPDGKPLVFANWEAAKPAFTEAMPAQEPWDWSNDQDPRFVEPASDDGIHQMIAEREATEEKYRAEQNAMFAGAHKAAVIPPAAIQS